jgi:hypothetical protein
LVVAEEVVAEEAAAEEAVVEVLAPVGVEAVAEVVEQALLHLPGVELRSLGRARLR